MLSLSMFYFVGRQLIYLHFLHISWRWES